MHGRFTGGTTGPRVDRVASVRDGDLIRVVVLTRTLDILVGAAEFVSRRSGLRHFRPRFTRGVLAQFANPVLPIAHGAVSG
ncbi:dihydroxy-acid dehydratase domain-containing protein [Microbacterium nanhaiense]|uniref:dihydroxy-acid dehydratase domain-containing protein n=1 Tax=Microbacterium nanhaiense TaxID=1301026 RepID=UPI001E4C10A8|nr:dihydroxy-acid dehydratase [Microbacterium nanhaiense]